MAELLPTVRNAVRAVILRDACVLMQHKSGGPRGERYTLPGGAPDVGETLVEGLRRECREEIGSEITVHGLVWVADSYKHRETEPPTLRHQVEFLFACDVPGDYVPINGPHPDRSQLAVVWMPLAQLDAVTLFPASLASHLRQWPDPAPSGIYRGVMQ